MLWTAGLQRRSSWPRFWRARTAAGRHARGSGRGRREEGDVRRKDPATAAEKATERTRKKSGGATVQSSLVQGKKLGRFKKRTPHRNTEDTEKGHQALRREQECLRALCASVRGQAAFTKFPAAGNFAGNFEKMGVRQRHRGHREGSSRARARTRMPPCSLCLCVSPGQLHEIPCGREFRREF